MGKSTEAAAFRAWCNTLLSAINAGLEQQIFGLPPGDNRWPPEPARVIYNFAFSKEVPGVAYVQDAGWDELQFYVALWPTPAAANWLGHARGKFRSGACEASGWLERRNGKWLQNSTSLFFCRKNRLDLVVATRHAPAGFLDRGKLMT
jgi:hypothetical protein